MQKATLAEELVKVVDDHLASLILFARQWNASNAEDVVQTALTRLVQFSYENGRPKSLIAWLFKAIRNEANNQCRNLSRRARFEKNFAFENQVWFEPIESSSLEAEEASESLKNLPIELREIVMMRVWGELSFDEIAESIQQPRTTVWRRYNEALEILRERLS